MITTTRMINIMLLLRIIHIKHIIHLILVIIILIVIVLVIWLRTMIWCRVARFRSAARYHTISHGATPWYPLARAKRRNCKTEARTRLRLNHLNVVSKRPTRDLCGPLLRLDSFHDFMWWSLLAFLRFPPFPGRWVVSRSSCGRTQVSIKWITQWTWYQQQQ